MSDKISEEKLNSIEIDARTLQDKIEDIISTYSKELDDYVLFVKGIVSDDENPPTDAELDDFTLRLSTLIYFTNVGAEQMGIRDDLSKAAYKEAYNIARSMIDKGTVADKNMQAEIDATAEHVVNIVYSKSYKILKAKVEAAQELLSSVKKVISRRMSEAEISHMQAYK